MKNDKLAYITGRVADACEDFLDLDKYELLDLVCSLHNELYKEVTGEYYDYTFHWANLGYGGEPNDCMFKDGDDRLEWCHNCGEKYSKNLKTCPKCGKKLGKKVY